MPALVLQKKICMVGAYGVGKTSLVRRFVESIFDDRYLTTIGVRIDKKTVKAGGNDINLIVWDLAGEDEITNMRVSHLRGASGYILVADGARASTLEKAVDLQQRVASQLGPVPFVLALNKADLIESWEVHLESITSLEARGWTCRRTSAKTGASVEDLFLVLARQMLKSL